jgi:hypothetical protein
MCERETFDDVRKNKFVLSGLPSLSLSDDEKLAMKGPNIQKY